MSARDHGQERIRHCRAEVVGYVRFVSRARGVVTTTDERENE